MSRNLSGLPMSGLRAIRKLPWAPWLVPDVSRLGAHRGQASAVRSNRPENNGRLRVRSEDHLSRKSSKRVLPEEPIPFLPLFRCPFVDGIVLRVRAVFCRTWRLRSSLRFNLIRVGSPRVPRFHPVSGRVLCVSGSVFEVG